MKSSRAGILLTIILLATAIGLALFGPSLFRKNRQGDNRVRQSIVRTAHNEFSAKGVVESLHDIELASRVEGVVDAVTADEGDTVSQGQLLVRFEDSKISARIELAEATLRAAKAQLKEFETGFRTEDVDSARSAVSRTKAVFEQARTEAQRQERLYQRGASTRVEKEQAEEKMKVALATLSDASAQLEKLKTGTRPENIEEARAQVEKARADLQYHRALAQDYRIESPIDGLVIMRDKDPRETVDIGTPLLTIIDPARLRIHAEIEETDVGRVRDGQVSEVFFDAFPGQPFRGKVTKVFPMVTKKSQRTFDPMASFDINTQKIYIDLDDYSGLVNGMTATVRFLK